MSSNDTSGMSAEDRKRMRLLAWKRKQQQSQSAQPPPVAAAVAPAPPPAPKISVSLMMSAGASSSKRTKKKKTKKNKAAAMSNTTSTTRNALRDLGGEDGDDEDDDDAGMNSKGRKRRRPPQDLMMLDDGPTATASTTKEDAPQQQQLTPPSSKRSRWDTPAAAAAAPPSSSSSSSLQLSQSMPSPPAITRPIVPPQPEKDALDHFMEKLQEGAVGNVTIPGTSDDDIKQPDNTNTTTITTTTSTSTTIGAGGGLSIHVSGSMVRRQPVPSGNVVTAEQIQNNQVPFYQPKDWLSDTGGMSSPQAEDDTDDEEAEERARRALIEALAAQPAPTTLTTTVNASTQQQQQQHEGETGAAGEDEDDDEKGGERPAQLASEVKTEKSRRQEQLRQLERQAAAAQAAAQAASAPELGPLYNDVEAGVMEEAERNLEAAKIAGSDALTVLADLNKKKELKAVDHSQIDYIDFQKNLYIVPRALANLSNDEVINRRAKLKVRVRGHGAPAPVSSFEECGLSERILQILQRQDILMPFPVQAQCIPCIMAGRDVIGVAKTGSGKTLAYLLPMLRHILVQPPLAPNESGPIGLVLAPARELAYQIHTVSKGFAKQLGLK